MRKKELVALAMETARACKHGIDVVLTPKGERAAKAAPSAREIRAFLDGVAGACDMIVACSVMDEVPTLTERVDALLREWLDERVERDG